MYLGTHLPDISRYNILFILCENIGVLYIYISYKYSVMHISKYKLCKYEI